MARIRTQNVETQIDTLDDGASLTTVWIDRVTIGIIDDGKGNIVKGIARCMPTDKFSKEVGKNLAYSRAVKSLAEQTERIWLSRSVTIKEWNAKHKS